VVRWATDRGAARIRAGRLNCDVPKESLTMRSPPRAAKTVGLAALLAAFGCGGLTPASLEFVDTIPAQPRIGDVTTVRFRAIDSTGQPMAGAAVDFSIPPSSNSGGVTLSPTSALSNKGDGIASTQIVASGARP